MKTIVNCHSLYSHMKENLKLKINLEKAININEKFVNIVFGLSLFKLLAT